MSMLSLTFTAALGTNVEVTPELFEIMYAQSIRKNDWDNAAAIAGHKDLPAKMRPLIAKTKNETVTVAWLSRNDLSDKEFNDSLDKERRSTVLKTLLNKNLTNEQRDKIRDRFRARPSKALAEVFLDDNEREMMLKAYAKLFENADSLSQGLKNKLRTKKESSNFTLEETKLILKTAKPSQLVAELIDVDGLSSQEKLLCLQSLAKNLESPRNLRYMPYYRKQEREAFFQKVADVRLSAPSEELDLYIKELLESENFELLDEEKAALETLLGQKNNALDVPENALKEAKDPQSENLETILSKIGHYKRLQAEIAIELVVNPKVENANKVHSLNAILKLTQSRGGVSKTVEDNITRLEEALKETTIIDSFYASFWTHFLSKNLQPFRYSKKPVKTGEEIFNALKKAAQEQKTQTHKRALRHIVHPQMIATALEVEAFKPKELLKETPWSIISDLTRPYFGVLDNSSKKILKEVFKVTQEELGGDTQAWEILDTLSDNFDGTFGELLEATSALS